MFDIKKGNNKFYIGNNEEKVQAEVSYFIDENNIITIMHTIVSPELGGQGVGKILIKKMVKFAREENTKIIPKCEYAKKEFTKNKEYEDVLFAGIVQ